VRVDPAWRVDCSTRQAAGLGDILRRQMWMNVIGAAAAIWVFLNFLGALLLSL